MNTTLQNPPMLSRKALLVACLAASLLPGCGSGSKTDPLIVVVGDRTVGDVVTELRRNGLTVSDDKTRLAAATFIILAQDSATGAMPQHRERLQEIAATGNLNLLWLFTNSLALNDPALLALQNAAAREMLYAYGLPGNAIRFAIDNEPFPIDPKLGYLIGWGTIGSHLKGLR